MSMSDPMFDESDLDEPDYRCPHGTFIGNPYGADYMCGWCEDGISVAEYREAMRARRAERARQYLRDEFFELSFASALRTFRHVYGEDYWARVKDQLFADADAIVALSDDEALAYYDA